MARPVGAAKDGAHAREQLVVDERLAQVVVAATVEAAYAVDRLGAGADDDHRHVAIPRAPGRALAQPSAEVEARAVRQHGVQKNQRGRGGLDELERVAYAGGGEHVEAVIGQLLLEEGACRRLVLDQDDRALRHGGESSTGSRRLNRCPLRKNSDKASTACFTAVRSGRRRPDLDGEKLRDGGSKRSTSEALPFSEQTCRRLPCPLAGRRPSSCGLAIYPSITLILWLTGPTMQSWPLAVRTLVITLGVVL